MDALRDYAKQLATIWEGMGSRQRSALVALVAVVLVGMAWITVGQRPEPMQVLFAELEPVDAAAIRDALETRNERFVMTDQGRTIRVAPGRVHALRIDLSAEGLPRGGGVGFELYDKSGLAMSKHMQNVNFARALQGELARTISSLDEVRSARIHLVIPKRRIFADEEKRPTASVVLNLGSGGLAGRSVKGVAHLIASAVEGMSAGDVTIMDQRGNVLQRASEGEGFAAMGRYQELARGHERDMEMRVTALLEPMLGIGNVRVKATMNYDFDAVSRVKDRYDPDRQVVRSEERTEEQREIEGSKPGANQQGEGEVPAAVAAAGGASKTKRGTERANYEIDKTTETVTRQSGVLQRMSVAVLVNSNAGGAAAPKEGEQAAAPTPITEAELKKIRDLVANASGYNAERGDTISVVQSPFQTDGLEFSEPVVDLPGMMPLIQGLVALAIALMVVFMVVRPLLAQLSEISPDLVDAATLPGTVEDVAKRLEDAEREARARQLTEQRQAVVEYANEEPEKTAEILRGWLNEG